MKSGWIREENLRAFCAWCAEQVGVTLDGDEWITVERLVLREHEQCDWRFERDDQHIAVELIQESGQSVVEVKLYASDEAELRAEVALDLMAGYLLK